jgi:hypothetical protein
MARGHSSREIARLIAGAQRAGRRVDRIEVVDSKGVRIIAFLANEDTSNAGADNEWDTAS